MKEKKPSNINTGHEVCVWPTAGGVVSLHNNIGPQGNTLQFAADGRHF